MTTRICVATAVIAMVAGLTLVAGQPLSFGVSSELLLTPRPTLLVESFASIFTVSYAFGDVLLATSTSEYRHYGFLWQGFGVMATRGPIALQADCLFTGITAEYLYGQLIVSTTIAGVEVGIYAAQLSGAVLGGPADGWAFRVAGSIGGVNIVSITEMGARIQDDDYDGITIVYAPTGDHKRYATNPLVRGQGFTGEKLTVSGLSVCCVEDLGATLYITCQSPSFQTLTVEAEGIDIGLCWLSLDLEVSFQLQTKSLVLTPTLVVGETVCIDAYVDVRTNAPDDTLYGNFLDLTGITVYGLGLTCSWNGVTVRELVVLDTGRYAITTPEYGSVIESIADAVADGHEFYADYWELVSVEVRQDGCCGGITSFLANTYFDRDAGGIFGWGVTHVALEAALSSGIFLTGRMEVDAAGLDHVGFGVALRW